MAFAAAVVAEGQGEQQSFWNVEEGLNRLLAEWNISDYQLFVTGDNNFRYRIYPEYKAGRKDRPTYLEQTKDYLVAQHGAIKSDGCEADDLIGVEQYKCLANGIESVVVSIDKDLDQLEGLHYSPEIRRSGVVVKPGRRYHVSPEDGKRFFYYQLLVGDSTDNIKGAAGIGKKKAPTILQDCKTDNEYINTIREYYSCDEEIEMNGACLWIWRKDLDIWKLSDYAE